MKKIISTGIIALSMTSCAFAGNITAESGVYINGEAGWSFVDAPGLAPGDISAFGMSYNQDAENYVLGASIGYDYAFNQNWMAGIEVGYVNMGATDYSYTNIPFWGTGSGSIKSDGIQMLLTGTYVASNGFNVFGKVGAIDQETTSSFTGPLSNASTKQEDIIPAFAVGVGYLFTQNLNLTLQYELTVGSDWNLDNYYWVSPNSPMSQNILSLGLTYKFPL